MSAVPSRPRTRILLGVVAAVISALGVATVVGPPGLGAATRTEVAEVQQTVAPPALPVSARLKWFRCPGSPTLDCASLTVPLDYSKPTGTTISLAVNRSRAKGSGRKIGSLLINPGGPGGSGVAFTPQAALLFGSRLTDRFDIVGFDPRGVGASAPVRCLDTKALDRYFTVDPSPDTPAERDAIFTTSKEMADGCLARNGADVLRHLGTLDAARDMEQLRKALGENQLSFFGFSYGTYLGAVYADLYPKRVRAFALDGALDPNASNDDRARLQAIGFEQALTNFQVDCAQRPSCRKSLGDVPSATIDDLFDTVETQPLSVGARSVGPSELTIGVVSMLYSERFGWPRLESALSAARRGEGAQMLALFDSYTDRNRDGSYRNTTEANVAINCVDVPSSRDPAHYDQLATELGLLSRHFGRVTAYFNVVCGEWAVPAVDQPRVRVAAGSAPILVIGTTQDPATPLIWAQQLASQLQNGRLLTVPGRSHTAYLTGSACVRTAVETYLVELTPPPRQAVC